MSGLNKAMIIGHLGRDPEMRYTQDGSPVANFSVATTEKYKDKENTEWHKVVAFGKLAEICGQYLQKGKQVYVEGRLQTRKYTGKDGTEKQSTEIIATSMQMLSGRGNEGGDADSGRSNAPSPSGNPAASDDIPF